MTRPYTVTDQPVVKGPLLGMSKWADLAVKHSDGALWDNGTWVNRDVRNRPGIISNHARGLAVDLSYRWLAQKKLGRVDGRKTSLAYIIKLLENADTLGIQLVIDYALQRSWKCDRASWRPLTSVEQSDWYHVEIDSHIAYDPIIVKQCWAKVFGASPTEATKSV